jgi:tRNA 2-thiouridine synthesizing protein E
VVVNLIGGGWIEHREPRQSEEIVMAVSRRIGDRTYQVDDQGFLIDFKTWDEGFAEGTAPEVGITSGLTVQHWQVLEFIRSSYEKTGVCPLVFQTCRVTNLKLKNFRALFPGGYLRGACRLAGITYKEGYCGYVPYPGGTKTVGRSSGDKTYLIDVRGFLVDPESWDEEYAICKAHELKMPEGLTEEHWRVIRYLRSSFRQHGKVPTVFDTCEVAGLEIDAFERLFPDGYHRGAVKIAGLKVR